MTENCLMSNYFDVWKHQPDIVREYHVKHIAQHIQFQYLVDEERENKVHLKSGKYIILHHWMRMFFNFYILFRYIIQRVDYIISGKVTCCPTTVADITLSPSVKLSTNCWLSIFVWSKFITVLFNHQGILIRLY